MRLQVRVPNIKGDLTLEVHPTNGIRRILLNGKAIKDSSHKESILTRIYDNLSVMEHGLAFHAQAYTDKMLLSALRNAKDTTNGKVSVKEI